MAVTAKDLDDFHKFAREKLDNGETDLSFDELLELWNLKNISSDEVQDSLLHINRGIQDAEAGQMREIDDVFNDLHVRCGSDSNK